MDTFNACLLGKTPCEGVVMLGAVGHLTRKSKNLEKVLSAASHSTDVELHQAGEIALGTLAVILAHSGRQSEVEALYIELMAAEKRQKEADMKAQEEAARLAQAQVQQVQQAQQQQQPRPRSARPGTGEGVRGLFHQFSKAPKKAPKQVAEATQQLWAHQKVVDADAGIGAVGGGQVGEDVGGAPS
eukprot:gene11319-18621_t